MKTNAAYLETISGRRRGLPAGLARLALSALQPIYGAVVATRNRLYDRGRLKITSVDAPVISVGNLTTGGTGKTPVVAAVVQYLAQRGTRPGIASRGYGSVDGAPNDEKRVLELLCPGVPHHQNRDRVSAASSLITQQRCDVIVLDDGFQHRRLARDLDIVLIDATNPWGYGHLLPRGLLRESKRSLQRAGLVMITRADLATEAEIEELRQTIRMFFAGPIVTSRFLPTGTRTRTGRQGSLDEIAGRSDVIAFCGIGNPEAFRKTLETLNVRLASEAFLTFSDHHAYNAADFEKIRGVAQSQNASLALCTLKDLVKVPTAAVEPPEIRAVEIGLEITEGENAWTDAIDAIAERLAR